MNIHALTVCVGYADFLRRSLSRWVSGLASVTVVSTPDDAATAILARNSGNPVQLAVTDAFYRDGAFFNKGRAQEEFWDRVPKDGWILLFDADIVPPEDWRSQIEAIGLKSGWLYGGWRYGESGKRIPDDVQGYGYFQLFHASDPLAEVRPFFDTYWLHAGNGDSSIMLRWKRAGRLAPVLPLRLTHLGENHNWFGLNSKEKFLAMERERRRRGGGWQSIQHERIDAPAG